MAAPPQQAATAAVRIGAELRAARESLGWSVADIAAHLRLREAYVEAIEEGQLETLPGHAYAVGFVRNYARLLDVDADAMARRFRTECPLPDCKTALAFLTPVPERGVPAGAAILLGLVLACMAYAVWFQLSAPKGQATDHVMPVPERLARMIVPVGRTAISPQVASIMPSAQTELGRLVIRARADCWVELRERKSGAVLLARTFKAGESWSASMETALLLTASSAEAVDIWVDGAAVQPFGQDMAPDGSPDQTASAITTNSTNRALSQ